VLGKYVRQERALTLEDAVRKMTSKPAEVFGFERRGLLKAGNFADIVIFNPETIVDKGTFVDPVQFPDGIAHVLINGELVLSSGNYDRKLAGNVLRKSRVQ
jgi:N-acyl-D-amino-acid deacylase